MTAATLSEGQALFQLGLIFVLALGAHVTGPSRPGAVDALTSQLVVRTFKGNKDAVAGDCAGVGQLVSGGVQASSPIEINRPYASEDGDPPTVWLGKASDPNDDIQVTVVCMT